MIESSFHALTQPAVFLELERGLLGCVEREILGELERRQPLLWLEFRIWETQERQGAASKPTSTLIALEQQNGWSWSLSMTQRTPHSKGSLGRNSGSERSHPSDLVLCEPPRKSLCTLRKVPVACLASGILTGKWQ